MKGFMAKSLKLFFILLTAISLFSCYDSGSGGKNKSGGSSAFPDSFLVKNIPDSASVISGTGSADLLFDGDTETSGTVYAELGVNVKYNTIQQIKKIKIFDSGSGSVTVLDKKNNVISGFSITASNTRKWISRELPECISADSLTFKITNNQGDRNAVHEIEIWTTDEIVTGDPSFIQKSSGNYTDITPAQIRDTMGSCVKSFQCIQTLSENNLKEFTFKMDIPASSFKRAIVKFEASGLFRGVSAARSVNGHVFRTGFNIDYRGLKKDDSRSFTDEINPMWLVTGSNTVSFNAPDGVEVSNVSVLFFTDNGWNNVVVSDNLSLFDGIESTCIKYFKGDSADFEFDREAEPSELLLNISGITRGQILLKYFKDGEWIDFTSGTVSVTEGLNNIKFPSQVRTFKIRLTVNDTGGAACVALNEVKMSSSPVGSDITPKVVLNYPLNGEYFDDKAYIDGYVYPSGENISIEGITDKRNADDGSFSIIVDRDSTKFSSSSIDLPWYPVVKAVCDGTYVNREVPLFANYNSSDTSAETPDGTNPVTEGLQGDGSYAMTIYPDSSKTISFESVTMKIPAGAVSKETKIIIRPLAQNELAALDPGMVNVTWPAAGYRFLPHGKFEKDIEVLFKYAKESLKSGMKDEDVFMHYYDEDEKRWKRLERISVEPAIVTVTSKTNHFTDIINATLTVPEHPDAMSFNPNSIKDLKAGDPSSGVNLIEAPKANNTGDVSVSYPIEIPKGRLGMAPSVSVNYNSEGGNSWTGIGWNVPVQSVTVDTKFGVPRYCGEERYILDGQQLVEIPGSASGTKIYRPRVEGPFARIQRFGDSPANYYWVVTDKRGTKSWYGQSKTGGNITVLQNGAGSGPVYQWCLERVSDTYGNCINYYYDIDNDPAGKQIYLSEIRYTGRNGSDGKYSVRFITSGDRTDITTSGRPGFMTSTMRRLDSIAVSYSGAAIRKYVLGYEYGVFGKTRLKSISQYDGGSRLFNTHTFEYYQDADGGSIFTTASTDSIIERLINISGISLLRNILTAFISDNWGTVINRSESLGVSGFVSGWFAPYSVFKKMGFGFTAGAGYTDGHVSDSMIDIDGDGLSDIVYMSSGSVKFRRNNSTGFDSAENVAGLPSLGSDSSYKFFGGPDLPFYVPVNLNVSFSKLSTLGYFSDVNGDGLADFVSAGGSRKIYYNNTVNGGSPIFKTTPPEYPGTVTTVTTGENVDFSGADIGDEPTWEYMNEKFYLDDPLRIWKAPFTGVVKISGSVKIAENNKPATPEYETDGVKVYIQKNNKLLWSEVITDTAEHTPQGVSEIFVERGDEIIFRVNSIDDGAYDIVDWDPLIEYTNEGAAYENEVDENGKHIYKYKASEDFSVLGKVVPWNPPMDGTVRVQGILYKGETSDDITIRVIHYKKRFVTDANGNAEEKIIETNIRYTQVYNSVSTADGDIFSIDLSGVKKSVISEDGKNGEYEEIVVEAASDTPVDATKVKLKTSVYYLNNDEGIEFKNIEKETLSFLNVGFKNHRPLDESSPDTPWIAPKSGTVSVFYEVESLYSAPFVMPDGVEIPVTIAVKRGGKLVEKVQGTVSASNERVSLTADISVSEGDRLYFILSSDYKNYRQHLQIGLPAIKYSDDMNSVNHPGYEYDIKDFDTRLGGGYRNWYYARWCGNNDILDRAEMLEINKDTLSAKGFITRDNLSDEENKTNADIVSEMLKTFKQMGQSVQLNEPENTLVAESQIKKKFYTADTPGLWSGNDGDCWISGGMMSSTRIVQKKIFGSKESDDDGDGFVSTVQKAGDSPSFDGGVAVKKVSDSWDFSVGALGVSATCGKRKTSTDYFDLNGDRFPDVVTGNTVQYTKPDGSMGSRHGYNGKGVNVSRTNTMSYSPNASYTTITTDQGNMYITKEGVNTSSWLGGVVGSTVISSAEFMDMNGDGLPDYLCLENEDGRVISKNALSYYNSASDINIYYNTGYAFSGKSSFENSSYISKSDVVGGSPAPFGFNFDDSRISGGLSLNLSNSRLKQCYMDLNGDGLPER